VDFWKIDFADFWAKEVPCFMLGFCDGIDRYEIDSEGTEPLSIPDYGIEIVAINGEINLPEKDLIALEAYKALMKITEETCAVIETKVG